MIGRAALGALFLTLSSAAAAAERVALLLPSCELPGVSASALREAIALDLQADGLVLAPAGELSPGRDVEVLVEASCPKPDELTLRAERATERQRRTLRLSELTLEQRARTLSLALTELVSLVLHPPPSPVVVEAAPEPDPANQLEPPPVAPPTPLPPPPSRSTSPSLITAEDEEPTAPAPTVAWRLGLAPQGRFFVGTSLWGAQLQLAHRRFRVGSGYLTSRTHAPSGFVWTSLAHASAGYAFPLWGDTEGTVLESGPRVGVGFTFLRARAVDGAVANDARDWYFDAAWTARFQAAVSASVRLGLGAELGYGRGPIGYADDVAIARTSGPFASAMVDVSYQLLR